jgi:hypothetical protein
LYYPLHPEMRIALCATACFLFLQGSLPAQTPQAGAAPQGNAGVIAKGLPPRATPGDYQARAEVGGLTIAAEFAGHSVPAAQAALANEDYVTVEVAVFGPPEAHAGISTRDFSLRINGRKSALPSQPFAVTFGSLKDPEWAPPESADSKSSKTSLGGGDQKDPLATPAPVHPPFALKRGWELEVQKAALPEGDRQLPVAGLLFFRYGGKEKGIDEVELIYEGSAGKVEIPLHP